MNDNSNHDYFVNIVIIDKILKINNNLIQEYFHNIIKSILLNNIIIMFCRKNIECKIFSNKLYKIIIKGINDYGILHQLYSQNRMLVLMEEQKPIEDMKNLCFFTLHFTNESITYAVGMKDPESYNIIIMNASKIIKPDPKLSMKYLEEQIIMRYDNQLAQHNSRKKKSCIIL